MMMRIKLKNIIATMFHKDFKKLPKNLIDYGGRGTTKSSKNALKVIYTMLKYPECETVVIRENGTHHRNSTVKELQTAFSRLGMSEGVHYTIRKTNLEISLLETGSKIYFGALNDPEKLKGFKPQPNKQICLLWFFECTEFKDELAIRQAVSTFIRGNKPFFTSIYEFNTPPNPNHWLMDWLITMGKNKRNIINFSTYEHLTEYEYNNWLGKDIIEEIEEMKVNNYELYKYIYLGQPLEQSILFTRSQFRWINGNVPTENRKRIMVIDPKSTGKDFFSCAILGLDDPNNMVLEDVIYTQEVLTDKLIKRVSDMCNAYGVRDIYIEVNKEYSLAIMLENLGHSVNTFNSRINKELKIISNAHKVKKFLLKETDDKEYNSFLNEIFGYEIMGKNKHDDATDCLTMASMIIEKGV